MRERTVAEHSRGGADDGDELFPSVSLGRNRVDAYAVPG